MAYGLQAKGLADQLGITFEEAEKLLADYKAAFPTVMAFLEELGAKAKERLEARTVTGRRRRWVLPTWDLAKLKVQKKLKTGELLTTEKVRKQYVGMFRSIEREGKNAPIQGANADLTKRAMFLVWQKLWSEFKALFVNSVHDEIVVECPDETADACCEFIKGCMAMAGAEWVKDLPMTAEGEPDIWWTK